MRVSRPPNVSYQFIRFDQTKRIHSIEDRHLSRGWARVATSILPTAPIASINDNSKHLDDKTTTTRCSLVCFASTKFPSRKHVAFDRPGWVLFPASTFDAAAIAFEFRLNKSVIWLIRSSARFGSARMSFVPHALANRSFAFLFFQKIFRRKRTRTTKNKQNENALLEMLFSSLECDWSMRSTPPVCSLRSMNQSKTETKTTHAPCWALSRMTHVDEAETVYLRVDSLARVINRLTQFYGSGKIRSADLWRSERSSPREG